MPSSEEVWSPNHWSVREILEDPIILKKTLEMAYYSVPYFARAVLESKKRDLVLVLHHLVAKTIRIEVSYPLFQFPFKV